MDENNFGFNVAQFNLPKSLFENSLPDATEIGYWQARKNRIFFIDYELSEDYEIVELGKIIITMNVEEMNIPKEELKPIYIYIHSYGGDLDSGFNFADICRASRIPIVTVAMGSAMSAAFLIFLSGERRYCFNHSQLLIHSGSATLGGTADQVAEAQKNYKAQIQQMKDYILSRTEIPEKVFNKNKSKDWYLSRSEIVDYKIATIIDCIDDVK